MNNVVGRSPPKQTALTESAFLFCQKVHFALLLWQGFKIFL
jgi:hypothetical protein